jgi:hypothetical protein
MRTGSLLLTGRRGTFRSVGQLEEAIHEILDAYNEDPRPFVWSASGDAILAKVSRCKAISKTMRWGG